jgi:outer membrane protein
MRHSLDGRNRIARTSTGAVWSSVLALPVVCGILGGIPAPANSGSAPESTLDLLQTAVDTPLAQVIRRVLVDHPQVIQAFARLQAAHERDRQSLAVLLPQATLQASGTTSRTSAPGGASDADPRDVGITVTQAIFNRQALTAREQIDPYIDAAVQEWHAVRQNVVMGVIDTVVSLLQAREVARLADNNAAVTQRHLEATQARFQVGELTKTDVSQALARAESARASAIQADNDVMQAVAKYRESVGDDPPADIQVPHARDLLLEAPLEALLALADQRPGVQAVRLRLRVAQLDVAVEQATHWPTVALTADASRGWHQTGTATVVGEPVDRQSLSLGVTLPIYSGGMTESRVEQMRQQRDQQQAALDQEQRQARREVEQGRLSLHTTRASLSALTASVAAARDALTGAEQEFRVGSRTLLDVLDAQHQLFTAETNLARSRSGLIQSEYRLLHAVGRLLPAPR